MQAASLRAPGDAVVVARELVKRFGGFTAVDGLGFSVRRGECFGLLGPNGAGKSTTLKLLLGLLAPDGGSVELVGEPVPRRALEARRRVGVVPQARRAGSRLHGAREPARLRTLFRARAPGARERLPELLEFAELSVARDAVSARSPAA